MAAESQALTEAEIARYTSARDYLGAALVWVTDLREHARTRLPLGARDDFDAATRILPARITEMLRTLDLGWSGGRRRAAYRAALVYVADVARALRELEAFMRREQASFEGRFWTTYSDLRGEAANLLKAGATGVGVAAVAGLLLLAWALKGSR